MGNYDLNHCAVTADLNRYLGKLDADDARQAIIDSRADDLLAGEYSPANFQNIMEALPEMTEDLHGDIAAGLRIAANAASPIERNIAHQVIGANIQAFVQEYWSKSAKRKAEDSVNDADCRHCYDQGCLHCDPPEPDDQ